MLRWVLIVFLVAHGLVHINLWVTRSVAGEGANPARSWLLGDQRAVSSGLAVVAALLFALAAVGLLLRTGWWGPVTVVAAGVSLLLTALFSAAFRPAPWIVAPLAINVVLIAGVAWFSWPTQAAFGG